MPAGSASSADGGETCRPSPAVFLAGDRRFEVHHRDVRRRRPAIGASSRGSAQAWPARCPRSARRRRRRDRRSGSKVASVVAAHRVVVPPHVVARLPSTLFCPCSMRPRRGSPTQTTDPVVRHGRRAYRWALWHSSTMILPVNGPASSTFTRRFRLHLTATSRFGVACARPDAQLAPWGADGGRLAFAMSRASSTVFRSCAAGMISDAFGRRKMQGGERTDPARPASTFSTQQAA
jgi:hypothetical protein